jgi:hypothetical protein
MDAGLEECLRFKLLSIQPNIEKYIFRNEHYIKWLCANNFII